ncbi:BTB/POZ domain-containing protein At3g50780-like [Chenopodium quinoa]|uniref:BTB/POZ domain-containing protein At3g50780-like n=1 Tax=Chenopodium quinoa TaxID=63459 RepID=UPI000B79945F|nr:BTB/POZ domain-containing protein At3g50780-like [Chenopodium quinoa]
MSEVKVSKGGTKIRNVPIAVTPEGFWCCPSPVVFQKNLKTQHPLNKSKPPPHPSSPPPLPSSGESIKKKPITNSHERKPSSPSRAKTVPSDDHKTPASNVAEGVERTTNRNKSESLPKKVSIEFGESGTSDMKVVLYGKHGFSVKLNVHKGVLVENSSFFAERLAEQESDVASLQILECEDVEIYVECVGLMYSKDMKQRLLKQSVQRVLRVLKVAEVIGFSSCIKACLDYLEAAPWVGEEEEEKVVSSVLRLQSEGVGVNPVLKRVSSQISRPPKDTLSHIVELVLKSNEERGRREMKSIVLKLLRENNSSSDCDSSPDICYETIYASCRSCLDSLLSHFKRATGPEFSDRPMDNQDPIAKQIALEADNLAWLLDILAERQLADEFALMWVCQQELAGLHHKLPAMTRYHVSCITARLFVGIGRGELLPSKDTRHMLLQTWLEPLTNDYSWLNHGCRSFDRKVVEEGIGRTILTLPLEEQQSILLFWLSNFLKSGDNCPNLQRAFEVWWRRTFIRPYAEPRVNQGQSDNPMTS